MDHFNEKLLDQIPEGLAAFDLEGRFIFWNKTLQALTGLAPSSVLGKKFFELFPDFKVKNQDFHLREAFAGRSALAHHFPFGDIQDPQLFFETFYGPLKNEAGQVTGAVALARDLSERMKELRLLEDREKRLRQFFEIAEEAIMVHEQGVIRDVNPALARMLGYGPEEMIGRPVSDFSDPVSAKKTQTYLAVGYPEGTYEYLAKRKDGTTFPMEVRGRDFEIGGKTLRVSTGWDITYRKKIERAIQESEERFKRFAEITREGILFHKDGKILDANQTLLDLTGRTASEVVDKNNLDFMTEESIEKVRRFRGEGYPIHPYEVTLRHKDGTLIPAEALGRYFTLDGEQARVVSVWDIRDRKKAEDALRQSEEKFRSLIENSLDMHSLIDAGGRVIYDSPSVQKVMGFPPEERLGRDYLRHVHPEDKPRIAELIGETLKAPGMTVAAEFRALRADGQWHLMEGSATNLLDHPSVKGIVANFRDITERKAAEEALRKSEAKFRSLIENSYDLITVLDREGKRIYESPSLERILGYKPGERQGLTFDTQPPEDREKGQAIFREALANPGKPIQAQLKALRKDGTTIDGDMVLTNLLDDPAVGGVVVNGRDVTERKLAEEALKQSEQNFRTLIERAPEAIFVHEGLKILYANPRLVELLEYQNQEQLLGSAPLTHIRSEDREKIRSRIERAQSGLQNPPLEIRVLCRDGSEKIVETVSVGVLFEGRAATMVMLRDLTEQKKAQEKIRQQDDFYRALLENTHDMITVVGPDGRSLYLGPGIQKVLGYSVEERLGKNAFEFIHPDDLAWAREAFAKLAQTPAEELVPFTLRMRHKDGNWRRVAGVAQNLLAHPLVKGTLINYRDVTEQEAAEEARRQSEEKFRSLIENSHDVISVTEKDGLMSYISPSVKHVLGYEPAERIGQGYIHIMHPEDMEYVRKEFSKLLQTQGVAWTLEFRLRHKDGSWRQVESTGINLLENPSVRGIVYNLRDVTEKKLAEEAKRQSEERFRRFAEVTQEGILIHDQGVALDANQVFADMVGLPLSKIVGQSSFEFMDEESRLRIEGYQRDGYPPTYEVRVKRKDGTTFPAEVHGRHFQWEGRDVRVISLFDITERKNTEQVLLKLERLSTIGEMAAGMAHEIRNPLAAISMAAQLMKRKKVEGVETFLQTILEQSARLEQ